MSSKGESYAASMIKRFRESKPTSRSERETARETGGDLHQMWWVEDDGSSSGMPMPQTKGGRYDMSASGGVDEFENPRLSRPAPNRQTTTHSDVLSELRQPDRENRISTNSNPFQHHSTIDEMIAREIQELEREINSDPKRTYTSHIECQQSLGKNYCNFSIL